MSNNPEQSNYQRWRHSELEYQQHIQQMCSNVVSAQGTFIWNDLAIIPTEGKDLMQQWMSQKQHAVQYYSQAEQQDVHALIATMLETYPDLIRFPQPGLPTAGLGSSQDVLLHVDDYVMLIPIYICVVSFLKPLRLYFSMCLLCGQILAHGEDKHELTLIKHLREETCCAVCLSEVKGAVTIETTLRPAYLNRLEKTFC